MPRKFTNPYPPEFRAEAVDIAEAVPEYLRLIVAWPLGAARVARTPQEFESLVPGRRIFVAPNLGPVVQEVIRAVRARQQQAWANTHKRARATKSGAADAVN